MPCMSLAVSNSHDHNKFVNFLNHHLGQDMGSEHSKYIFSTLHTGMETPILYEHNIEQAVAFVDSHKKGEARSVINEFTALSRKSCACAGIQLSIKGPLSGCEPK